ncbi:NADH-quinone oxidoreductase subunit F [Allostreptomyces psammosilenae]|uniref:NADH-quinone oxidoreductase subunit F n=1 Tax=Allostreptomyces psammosilenae TaxID=1892865 RepID=A0A852ZYN9_9ACTN|nr:NADH-quinone oxidoreductase subunit F [Allostreptomyces psammosilenae]
MSPDTSHPGPTKGEAATDLLAPVLSAHWDEPDSYTLDGYLRHDGYQGLRTAFGMPPDDVIAYVKDAGLRGRGGAGFPTGMKWQFIPQNDGKPHYLVVNADESEPGTCKDIPLLLANPHALIEGMIIAAYAIRSSHAFVYLRGEVVPVLRRLHAAVAEAYAAGYLGRDILGSGFDLDITVHAGAGAYICGEETALLDSLEGRRGQPRLRPPFPAVAGLYACPTVVNNVESIASVPAILHRGKEWFRSMGSEKSPGFTLYSLSGHVKRPGQYEAPLGITLRQLLDLTGGIREGHRLKFWTPGGSSTPMFTDEHLDVPLDYEGVAAAGSMLGTKALQIFDETTCVVRAVTRWTEFYAHESCGKCTPCREGTYWLVQLLRRLDAGQGSEADLDKLQDIADNINGKSFCALGDGAASPIFSSLKYFRDEYLEHLRLGRCPFDPDAATVFGPGRSGAARAHTPDTPGGNGPTRAPHGPGDTTRAGTAGDTGAGRAGDTPGVTATAEEVIA